MRSVSDSVIPRISRLEAWNLVALIVAQVVVGLVGLASTRYLAPADKGLFVSISLWALVVQTVVGLSLPNALLFYGVAGGRSRPSKSVLVLLGSVALLCGAALARFLAGHAGASATLEVLVLALPFAMLAFETSTYSALAEGRPFHLFRITQAVLFGAAGLPILIRTHSVTLLTAALLASYLASVALASFPLGAVKGSARVATLGLRDLLRWSLRGHAGLTLSLLATRMDMLFVTLFLSPFAAGQYTAAAAFPNLLAFSGTAAGLALARRTTANSEGGVPQFARSAGYGLLIGTGVIALALIVWRDTLVVGLFGHPYLPAAPILVPLALSLPLSTLASYEAQLLVAIGRPSKQTIGQGIAALALAGGSAWGVMHGDVLVIAWSNVVAYLLSVAWQTIALERR